MKKSRNYSIYFLLVLALMFVVIILQFVGAKNTVTRTTYNLGQLETDLQNGNITAAIIYQNQKRQQEL